MDRKYMERWVREELPKSLPDGWRKLSRHDLDEGARRGLSAGVSPDDVYWYRNQHNSLMVAVSGRTEADGKRWLHVSYSLPNRMPSYDHMTTVKKLFVGRQNKAIFVLPSEDEHVNMHSYCLHLWRCMDGDPLPDFRVTQKVAGLGELTGI